MPTPANTEHRTSGVDLVAALIRSADGVSPMEAAVRLLADHGFWPEQLHEAGLIDLSQDEAGHTLPLYAQVRWTQALTALDRGRLTGSSSDRRMLRLAASLAVGTPVDLADGVCALDLHNLHLLLAALRHASGATAHRPGRDRVRPGR